ncbi:hypothetical protein AB1N83_014137 [Pleurotus pulmonarius]
MQQSAKASGSISHASALSNVSVMGTVAREDHTIRRMKDNRLTPEPASTCAVSESFESQQRTLPPCLRTRRAGIQVCQYLIVQSNQGRLTDSRARYVRRIIAFSSDSRRTEYKVCFIASRFV